MTVIRTGRHFFVCEQLQFFATAVSLGCTAKTIHRCGTCGYVYSLVLNPLFPEHRVSAYQYIPVTGSTLYQLWNLRFPRDHVVIEPSVSCRCRPLKTTVASYTPSGLRSVVRHAGPVLQDYWDWVHGCRFDAPLPMGTMRRNGK